ncbi:GNAT family N-acetyltransferase [Chitinophaga caeni]|uniref:GNAT family N-acetyltransferase n=1 Tax=Chitinophaga caeni TaxID=2029983 RepID=A0A291R017_9BACT|nr:GNAT family protein [Chitinophaga caeni]ATL49538.1 GNAT family N-acetyltransferase [Chitinophaga caeni]
MYIDFQPELSNKRVLLRPLHVDDVAALLPFALDPELWEVGVQSLDTVNDLTTYIETAIKEREAELSIPFVVIDREQGNVVGCTRYMNISEVHKRLEIGSTWLNPKLHGSGVNKAMKYALLQHAFEVMGFNRVELKTDERNRQSQLAIKSIGAQYEGTLREHMITYSGHRRNTVYFSILASEWPGVKERIFSKYDF